MSNECPLCKYKKIKMMENWVGIDRILFDNYKLDEIFSNNQILEYRNLKSMMLLNLSELYDVINYYPVVSYDNLNIMESAAIQKAFIYKNNINENIFEDKSDLNNINFYESLYKNTIDLLLFEDSAPELNSTELNEDVKLLVETHKNCRDELISYVLDNLLNH